MHEHRSAQQTNHQHNPHSGDGADHHQCGYHDGDEAGSVARGVWRWSPFRIDTDEDQILVSTDQQQTKAMAEMAVRSRSGCVGGKDVAKQN